MKWIETQNTDGGVLWFLRKSKKKHHKKESEGMTELKSCPFCGAKAMLVYCTHGIGANWAVECTDTHAHRMEFSGPQDEVIKEWNKRVKG